MLRFFEEEIELKYLRYCEFLNPVHSLTQAMTRGAITAGRLRVRLGRAREMKVVPEDERNTIWDLARRIIDYVMAVQTNPMFQRYRWHMKSFFPWDALVWILNECQRDPSGEHNEEGWKKVQEVYDVYPDLVTSKRALHVAVGRLTLRRWDMYAAVPPLPGRQKYPEPSFIPALREKFEKRSAGRSNTETSQQQPYNPFQPPQDDPEDWAIPMPVPTTQSSGDMAFHSLTNINFDVTDMDWMFWENLLQQDPSGSSQPSGADSSGLT